MSQKSSHIYGKHSILMQIDATMISDQTNDKFMELEVLMEHTQVWTGTEGMVHSSGSIEKQALTHLSTTARRTNQILSRVSNKKTRSGVTKKINFSRSVMKQAVTHYIMAKWLGYIHCIDAGMRNLPAQRLSRQVKNMDAVQGGNVTNSCQCYRK